MSLANKTAPAALPALPRLVARFEAENWARRAVYVAKIYAVDGGYYVEIEGRTHAVVKNGRTHRSNVEAGSYMRDFFKMLGCGAPKRILLGTRKPTKCELIAKPVL